MECQVIKLGITYYLPCPSELDNPPELRRHPLIRFESREFSLTVIVHCESLRVVLQLPSFNYRTRVDRVIIRKTAKNNSVSVQSVGNFFNLVTDSWNSVAGTCFPNKSSPECCICGRATELAVGVVVVSWELWKRIIIKRVLLVPPPAVNDPFAAALASLDTALFVTKVFPMLLLRMLRLSQIFKRTRKIWRMRCSSSSTRCNSPNHCSTWAVLFIHVLSSCALDF